MTSYKKRIILKAAGGIFGLVLIVLLLKKTDINQLLSQMRIINFNFFWVIGVTFISQLMGSLGWQYSLLENIPFKKTASFYSIRLAGESLAQINPASFVAGDTLKAVLLKHINNINYKSGAMSLLLWRIMYILSTGFLLVFSVIFIFNDLDYANLKTVSMAIAGFVLLLFIYIFHSLKYERGVFALFADALNACLGRFKFVINAVKNLNEIDRDMVQFYHSKKKNFYSVFFLTILHRVIGSLEYYVILTVLGMNISIFTCIVFDTATLLFRSAGFFIPGQLGLEEFGNKLMFSIAGIPGNETWLTVSVIRRARQIFWILAGFFVYLVISGDFKDKIKVESENFNH
ncbi:MAG: flippase-like domain-containing protein [Spirochaetes bacterium]|nr:flippase-like domain-containing protein [Spirochaetota bacterium]